MDPILVQINKIICWLKKTLVNSSIPLSGNVDCMNYIDFSPGLGTLLLQCLQTIATRPTHIFNPSLIMNSMVLPMWCCITGLVFAFSGISLWSLDDDYENCATGCTVSDDVSWLSKYGGNSGEPTLLLHSSRGQMCK